MKALDFGLDYSDWSTLELYSHEVNKIKNPQPRLTRSQALIELESLKGTFYEDISGALMKLIDIFEDNKWE